MNTGLWTFQVLLAVSFALHAFMMISPPAQITGTRAQGMKYVYDLAPTFRVFIGVAEVLASLAMILPGLTGILPWLTPLAAAGLMLVMVSATVFHIARREYPNLVLNLILLAMAAVVAYGRWALVRL